VRNRKLLRPQENRAKVCSGLWVHYIIMKLLPTLLSALIMIMFCIQAGACRSSGVTSSVPTPPAGSYTTGLFEIAYGTTILQASGASVSPEFFPGVSARPLLGRLFLPKEYLAGKRGWLS